jgi:hypothetical protein
MNMEAIYDAVTAANLDLNMNHVGWSIVPVAVEAIMADAKSLEDFTEGTIDEVIMPNLATMIAFVATGIPEYIAQARAAHEMQKIVKATRDAVRTWAIAEQEEILFQMRNMRREHLEGSADDYATDELRRVGT